MKISILTLFPELYEPFLKTSLLRRAQEQGLVSCDLLSMFSLAEPKKRIDGTTFGHGPGMLIQPEIVEKGIVQLEKKHGQAFKIFFSPHGKKLDQVVLRELYEKIQQKGGHCALLPARYEGMDARVEEHYADAVVSVGDFVLMGGDLPAMTLLEGLLRYIPGVVGQKESVEADSFTGPFVDHPHYTAPIEWKGLKVSEVVRSGDHAAIEAWREDQAVQRTVSNHFDWLRSCQLTDDQKKAAKKHIPAHYAALMHSGVDVRGGTEGTSSVTSIDIHDIARSTTTFGLKNYFVVTPLDDQKKIVQRLLDFWNEGAGVTYRECRHRAVKNVRLVESLDAIIAQIEKEEGVKPIVVATSASKVMREIDISENITYYDQEKVWGNNRPVLILFGTGNGLGKSLLQRCDYILEPIQGFSSFNHLSVRSATAIILDRWLGINIKYR